MSRPRHDHLMRSTASPGARRHLDLQLDGIAGAERRPADERAIVQREERADAAAVLVDVDQAALRAGDEDVVPGLELVGPGDGVEPGCRQRGDLEQLEAGGAAALADGPGDAAGLAAAALERQARLRAADVEAQRVRGGLDRSSFTAPSPWSGSSRLPVRTPASASTWAET